ncbi:hypothetical protein FAGKG844_60050 [Frankia sp. AgKG'84/4]
MPPSEGSAGGPPRYDQETDSPGPVGAASAGVTEAGEAPASAGPASAASTNAMSTSPDGCR